MNALGMDREDAKAVLEHLRSRPHRVMVTQGTWAVSYTTGSGIDGAILRVSRWENPKDLTSRMMRGDHDGRQFGSVAEATQFAFEHGYLQVHVKRVACSHCRGTHGFWCEATGQLRSDIVGQA